MFSKSIFQILFFSVVHWDKLQYPFTRESSPLIRDIQDGQVVKNLMKQGEFLSVPEHLGLILNTDGVQTFNASKHSIWPIYFMISNLPPQVRILEKYLVLAGAWFGPKKPTSMSTVLKPVLNKVCELFRGPGVQANTLAGLKTIKCVLLAGVFDLPAKAAIMNTVQFNGYYGCSYCKDKGTHINRRHIYLPDEPHEARTEFDMSRWASEAKGSTEPVFGVKGVSVLFGYLNIPYGIPIDYMHAVLEGVVKALLKCWFGSESHSRPYNLRPYISQIDKAMQKIKPPHELPRRPRSIESSLKFWKASEYRAFILFYAVPVLKKYLPSDYVCHLSLLVFSLSKLLSDEIKSDMLTTIQKNLELFYKLIPRLYGEEVCTANMHSLIHLVKFVSLWGPLWTLSTFPFENANGVIKRHIHGTRNILQQMVFMVKLRESFLQSAALKETPPGSDIVLGKVFKKAISGSHSEVLGIESPATVFSKARVNGIVYYSSEWEKPGASRRSSVVSFRFENETAFGIIHYFCLRDNDESLALINTFSIVQDNDKAEQSALHDQVDPCLLNDTVFKASLETNLKAVPVTSLLKKCIIIPTRNFFYIVVLPNLVERH